MSVEAVDELFPDLEIQDGAELLKMVNRLLKNSILDEVISLTNTGRRNLVSLD